MTDWRSTNHDPENCPGCRPTIFDPRTGDMAPATHPLQQAANKAWRDAMPAQRVAWHRVTCLHSTNPTDQMLAQTIATAIRTYAVRQH